MVKYSFAAIEALLSPIKKIMGQPQFSILYQLSHRLFEHLRKTHNPIHKDDGYAGYMLSEAA